MNILISRNSSYVSQLFSWLDSGLISLCRDYKFAYVQKSVELSDHTENECLDGLQFV